jgi:hypothetical protein
MARGDDLLAEWSLVLEKRTGHDSAQTIEEHYEQTPSGAYLCAFPGCGYRRHDPAALWRHMCLSGKHGLPFGTSKVGDIEEMTI